MKAEMTSRVRRSFQSLNIAVAFFNLAPIVALPAHIEQQQVSSTDCWIVENTSDPLRTIKVDLNNAAGRATYGNPGPDYTQIGCGWRGEQANEIAPFVTYDRLMDIVRALALIPDLY